MKEVMEKELAIIRDFANKMGYEVNEYAYTTYSYNPKDTGRPAYIIELEGTSDSEGNPYCWAWFTDTYTPMG